MGLIKNQSVRRTIRLSRNQGFTIVEVLIAVAILGLVAVGASTVMTDIFKTQSLIVDRDEANEFAASLSRFLNGDSSCSSALDNTLFPVDVAAASQSETGTPIKITGYSGYGVAASSNLEVGTQVGRRLRIKVIDMKNKGVPPQDVVSGAATFKRYVAQIRLQFEQNSEGSWKALPPRFYEIPVLVDAAGAIKRCQVDLMIDDACRAIGSQYDAASGTCLPTTQCQMKGTFVSAVCSPAYGGCNPGVMNPLTGSASCPAGVTASHTGHMSSTFQVPSGQKKVPPINVTQSIDFYVCMQCN